MRHAVGALAAIVFSLAGCMSRPARGTMPGPDCARTNTEAQVYRIRDFRRVDPPPGIYTIEGYVVAYARDAGVVRIAEHPHADGNKRRELTLRVAEKRSLEVGSLYRFDVRVQDADDPWLVGCGLADTRLAAP